MFFFGIDNANEERQLMFMTECLLDLVFQTKLPITNVILNISHSYFWD